VILKQVAGRAEYRKAAGLLGTFTALLSRFDFGEVAPSGSSIRT
jgi:hypothetical protein